MTKKIYIISVIWLIIDQISKTLIEIYIPYNKSIKLINNICYLNPNHNTGAAFGLLDTFPILIIIGTILAIIIIYRYMFSFKQNKRNMFAFGLLLGGIMGNLLDRIIYGYVRDFIDIDLFKLNFPIFNIADIGICIGIFLLIVAIIKGEDKHENKSRR